MREDAWTVGVYEVYREKVCCIALCGIALFYVVLCCIALCGIALFYVVLCCIALCCVVLCRVAPSAMDPR